MLLSGVLGAMTVSVPAEFRQIVAASTLIVRGRVTTTEPVRTTAGDLNTVATIQVFTVLKGTADTFVSVMVPGGRLGRIRTVMVGAPRLEPNDAAVFFLKRGGDGLWRPVGLSMGIFRITSNRVSGRAEVRPPVLGGSTSAPTGPVVRGDRRRHPLSLQEFDAMVRIAMAPSQPGRLSTR
jgi:hypothetical protein